MVNPEALVVIKRTVRAEDGSGTELRPGMYRAEMGNGGAVFVRHDDGRLLGVKPGEFGWCIPGDLRTRQMRIELCDTSVVIDIEGMDSLAVPRHLLVSMLAGLSAFRDAR